jgi:hypothetical protein
MDGVKSGGESLEDIGEALPDESQGAMAKLIGDGIEGAVVGLVDRLSKAKNREVIAIMQEVTDIKVGDKWIPLKAAFNSTFTGKIKRIHGWLAFAIKVQFQDF